jgi:hypothetical protein
MITGYINQKTGELMSVTEEQEWQLERIKDEDCDDKMEDLPEWMQEIMPKIKQVLHSEDYIPLPSSFDIHEYAIMKNFCQSVEDPELKQELLIGIDGRGAFRMFKELIFRHDIRDNWFAYKNEALKQKEVDFLEAQDIPYVDNCL